MISTSLLSSSPPRGALASNRLAHAALTDQPERIEPFEEIGANLRTLADEYERFRVGEPRDERIDVVDVIRPNRYTNGRSGSASRRTAPVPTHTMHCRNPRRSIPLSRFFATPPPIYGRRKSAPHTRLAPRCPATPTSAAAQNNAIRYNQRVLRD